MLVVGDVCPFQPAWGIEQWLVEQAAQYSAQQPIALDQRPAWQTQGIRQVLTLDAEARDAERQRQRMRQASQS